MLFGMRGMADLKVANVAFAASFIAIVMGIAVSQAPARAEERVDFWGFAGFEELDTLSDDGSMSQTSDLDTAAVLEGRLRYQNRYTSLQRFRAEVNGRTRRFLDFDDRSSNRVRSRAEWHSYFSERRRTELRLRAEHEYKWRDDDWIFNRLRARAELRHEINPRNLVFAIGQVGQTDFNDEVATGLDHVRYVGEIGHEWTPNEDRTRLRTRIGIETADADEDRRSYDGVYVAVDGRHPIGERTEIFGEGRIHLRDYDGAFALPDPTMREDERYRLTGGARYAINRYFDLIGEAGWAANHANVDERQYDGFVFRLGVETNFNIWRSDD